MLPALVLTLLLLPFLFYPQLCRLPSAQTAVLIGFTFLLLGIFCAWNGSITGIRTSLWIEERAQGAASRLRAHIGSLPFPSEGTAALLQALVTGDRSGLSEHSVAVFRSSGASHILALSGLHMGVIYLVFDKASQLMGRSPAARNIRFWLLLGGSGFFTLMAGAGPSLVRAFLFITINETLRLLGRPRKALRVLCLALLLQLVLEPSAIRSLGFQLSYLAMAGIFLLFPLLDGCYPPSGRFDPFRKIWSLSALSIACQAFTGPLVWLRFHTFPRYFLLTNLLAMPLTTALLGTAVLTLVLSAAGLCPAFLYTATDTLCRLLVGVLEIIAAM